VNDLRPSESVFIRVHPWLSNSWRLLALALACFAASFAAAQSSLLFGKLTGFKVPEYYDPPNHRQMKSLLRGDEAEPGTNGCIRIRKLTIETYRENGAPEAFVEAPECIYDPKTREAYSAGPIKARTADRKLEIQGTGFHVLTTNKSLTISNNVRTVIRGMGTVDKTP
jgi:hypothetical protein